MCGYIKLCTLVPLLHYIYVIHRHFGYQNDFLVCGFGGEGKESERKRERERERGREGGRELPRVLVVEEGLVS